MLALAFGALGATAHCLYVLTGAIAGRKPSFAGYRIGWFFPQPILGAVLGALVYVTIRGGLLSTSSGASPINMFTVAAISAIGGLSAPRAYKRLTGQTATGDTQTGSRSPTITQVSPTTLASADLPQKATVTGFDLAQASFLVNGRSVEPDQLTDTSATFRITAAIAAEGHAVITLAPNVAAAAAVRIT